MFFTGISEHDFARRLNGFCIEKHYSKATVVGVLRTARENAKRARLIPIRIDERKNRQSRDSSDR